MAALVESSVTYPNVVVLFGINGVRATIVPGPGETARFYVDVAYVIQPSVAQAIAAVRTILGFG